jgi:hypothetical protein
MAIQYLGGAPAPPGTVLLATANFSQVFPTPFLTYTFQAPPSGAVFLQTVFGVTSVSTITIAANGQTRTVAPTTTAPTEYTFGFTGLTGTVTLTVSQSSGTATMTGNVVVLAG